MQASYINDAILYMQTYKDMRFTPDAILADGVGFIEPEFLQILGDNGNYILTRATWSKDLAEAKQLVETVNQMFKERYGTNMTGNSARAFTGMLVLADAINRASSTDSEAIREALLETDMSGDKLIMHGVKFDRETHQNTLVKGIICQIIGHEYYTVWPWNLATKELIWPMPKWSEREKTKIAIVFDTSGLDVDGFNSVCLSGAKKAEEELKIELDYVVAKTIPEQKFALIDGTIVERENVASFLFRDEESSFLAGALAAIVSKTNKTGFVGGMDIPAINRFLAGYYAGTRYINLEILSGWIEIPSPQVMGEYADTV